MGAEPEESEVSAREPLGLPMKIVNCRDHAVLADLIAKRPSSDAGGNVDMRLKMRAFAICVQFEINRSGICAGITRSSLYSWQVLEQLVAKQLLEWPHSSEFECVPHLRVMFCLLTSLTVKDTCRLKRHFLRDGPVCQIHYPLIRQIV